MKYTSAEAAKLLKSLNDEISSLLEKESYAMDFVAATTEDIESVRPEYDFIETQRKIESVQEQVRKVKHAINVFNTVTVVPGFDKTIDEMLVFIPQLTAQKSKLFSMRNKQPKVRDNRRSMSDIIDYVYVNYDLNAADAEYKRVSDLLSKAQTALDTVNNSTKFDIDL